MLYNLEEGNLTKGTDIDQPITRVSLYMMVQNPHKDLVDYEIIEKLIDLTAMVIR